MSLRIECAGFDPVDGFLYYVAFKPDLEIGKDALGKRTEVSAALSISETGDLADVAFEVPEQYRNDQALTFIHRENSAEYVEPHVFVAVPGSNGDAVVSAPATLEVDPAGRIIGMEIQWMPIERAGRT